MDPTVCFLIHEIIQKSQKFSPIKNFDGNMLFKNHRNLIVPFARITYKFRNQMN